MEEECTETITGIDNKIVAVKNSAFGFSVSLTHSHLWLSIFPTFLSRQNILCAQSLSSFRSEGNPVMQQRITLVGLTLSEQNTRGGWHYPVGSSFSSHVWRFKGMTCVPAQLWWGPHGERWAAMAECQLGQMVTSQAKRQLGEARPSHPRELPSKDSPSSKGF